ncbi:MAG TPA: response regulator [Rudaea sp.]|jgi:CheY-like chemotaxis protein|uniref:response regulator n=1 Tax=Rudaea sp. TaxID=2136325 RepID=UPI002F953EE7
MAPIAPPRILVADDDSVSLLFLASALHELGCEVTAVANGMNAIAACEKQKFDLLLLDRRMPDLGGAPLLQALRARGNLVVAIATSAELDAITRDELHAAGYVDALTKPIGIDRLASVLADTLPDWQVGHAHIASTVEVRFCAIDLLDDTGALASVGGDAAALRGLRGLLLQDLAATIPLIAATVQPMSMQDLRDYLHRLRAACRYCGTPMLAVAAARLEAKLGVDDRSIQVEFVEFVDACERTSAALVTQLSPEAS